MRNRRDNQTVASGSGPDLRSAVEAFTRAVDRADIALDKPAIMKVGHRTLIGRISKSPAEVGRLRRKHPGLYD